MLLRVCWGQAHDVQRCRSHALNITLCSSQVMRVYIQRPGQPCLQGSSTTTKQKQYHYDIVTRLPVRKECQQSLIFVASLMISTTLQPAGTPCGFNQLVATVGTSSSYPSTWSLPWWWHRATKIEFNHDWVQSSFLRRNYWSSKVIEAVFLINYKFNIHNWHQIGHIWI